MNKYSDEQKQEVIEQYANGESVSDIVADFQIPRSTIYSWITENQNSKKRKNMNKFINLTDTDNR